MKRLVPRYTCGIFYFTIESISILKRPKVRDLSIGNVAPIPNQRATAIPIKKTVVATGRRNGFWNNIEVLVAHGLDVPNCFKNMPNFIKYIPNFVKDIPNCL